MLSKKCQYALHALVHLAQHDRETVQAVEIYESKRIPRKFLEIILLDLKKGGVLGSKQGKGGGYFLRKAADQISLLEIIRLIDGAVAMLPCVSIHYYESCGMCEDELSCQINKVFSKVRDQTNKILSQTFLSEIAADEKKFHAHVVLNGRKEYR